EWSRWPSLPPSFRPNFFVRRGRRGQRSRAVAPRAANLQDRAPGTMKDFSAKRDGTVFAISKGMARPRPLEKDLDSRSSVRIEEECLELDAVNPRDIRVLRSLMGRVNGPAYPQPYVVE